MRENADLNDRLSRACREMGLRWRRFEVPSAAGYPDAWLGAGLHSEAKCECCGTATPSEAGPFAWIESKILRTPDSLPEYRRGQLAWAMEASKFKERCATITLAYDDQFRIWNTSDMAVSKLFERVTPAPVIVTRSIVEAIDACLKIVP